jgi:hypothetical protein
MIVNRPQRSTGFAADRSGGVGVLYPDLAELDVDVMPPLLGEGLRLFEELGGEPVELERVKMSESGQRTTIRFRVVRNI